MRVKRLLNGMALSLCGAAAVMTTLGVTTNQTAHAYYDFDDTAKGTVATGVMFPGIQEAARQQQIRFIAFGDAGTGKSVQWRLAEQMEELNKVAPIDFGLMLGDNIIPKPEITKYGAKVFAQPYRNLRQAGVDFFPVLGNRDVMFGYPQNLLDYYGMPASYYDYVVGPVHFFAIDTNTFNKDQQEWLTQRLENSISSWKVVYGHHPVYSSGHNGNTPSMQYALRPILEIYGADLYLSAHDHDYERFTMIEGVNYMVSGGGGAEPQAFSATILPDSVKRLRANHFVVFDASPEALSFQVVDDMGRLLDKGSLSHRPTMKKEAHWYDKYAPTSSRSDSSALKFGGESHTDSQSLKQAPAQVPSQTPSKIEPKPNRGYTGNPAKPYLY